MRITKKMLEQRIELLECDLEAAKQSARNQHEQYQRMSKAVADAYQYEKERLTKNYESRIEEMRRDAEYQKERINKHVDKVKQESVDKLAALITLLNGL